MGKNIDIEKVRETLLEQRKKIDKKLHALSLIEKIADEKNMYNVSTLSTDEQNKFQDMTIVDSCRVIFKENSYKEFTVKKTMDMLRKGGLQLSTKYAYTTVSSTLNRLVNKGILKKRYSGTKSLFQFKNAPPIE